MSNSKLEAIEEEKEQRLRDQLSDLWKTEKEQISRKYEINESFILAQQDHDRDLQKFKKRHRSREDETWMRYKRKSQSKTDETALVLATLPSIKTAPTKMINLYEKQFIPSPERAHSRCQHKNDPHHLQLILTASNAITKYLGSIEIAKRIVNKWMRDHLTSNISIGGEIFVLSAIVCFAPIELSYSINSEWSFFGSFGGLDPNIRAFAGSVSISNGALSIPKDLIFAAREQALMEQLLKTCFVRDDDSSNLFGCFAHNDEFHKNSGQFRAGLLATLFLKKIMYSIVSPTSFSQMRAYLHGTCVNLISIIANYSHAITVFPEIVTELAQLYRLLLRSDCYEILTFIHSHLSRTVI